ncbi:uncharacterized protein LOC113771263 [Coffea eugenioides]|uniref:uncharacterized protein LOC113771263 n=1 Tax=Coffea eugenioides TaxID=49369 RepID=UPI000F606B27|nr:uncharacterized protein LOC113771263 [Coffea eugenioides]
MSTCGVYRQQLVLFGSCCCPPQQLPKLLPHRKTPHGLPLQTCGKSQLALIHDASSKFVPRATASAASSSSSPTEYSEQLLGGVKPKQKKQRIAGVDQDDLQDPKLLADPESCFCEFKGVQIHYKIFDAESLAPNLSEEVATTQVSDTTERAGFPMILLHGFGASVFSWNRVMKPLAQVTGSKVLAFDRPAFGLTSWVDPTNHSPAGSADARPLNPYSIMFSVMASLYFIDFLAAEKAILVGHSAGSLVAVDTYFEAPERVAAMVLVAPAILAPLLKQDFSKDKQRGKNNKKQEEHSNSDSHWNPILRLFSMLSKLTKHIAQAIMNMLKGMGDMINYVYKKALSALLRSAIGVMLVRMIIDKFGIAVFRNSWYDSNQVTDYVLQGYTKGEGWDKALVEYTVAMLSDSSSQSKPQLSKRLGEISCPVLIVTGDSDRLVPPWNSKRLSQVIPGSHLEVIKNCGHLPHEEKTEEFVSIVEKFLQRTFGASQEQRLQVVT